MAAPGPDPAARTPTPRPDIRLFVMDVDGTLTDGTITYGADGTEWKSFHARDGLGIKLLPLAGIEPAIVTARDSAVVSRRAEELGIRHVVQGATDKRAAVLALCARLGVSADAVAYVGDDLSDLPAMTKAAFSAAPSDAAAEVRAISDYVCLAAGGRGAVREAIEHLLKSEGLWDRVLSTYVGTAGATAP